jgi:hypothetical protein
MPLATLSRHIIFWCAPVSSSMRIVQWKYSKSEARCRRPGNAQILLVFVNWKIVYRLRCLANSSNSAHAHWVVSKWGPFRNYIALLKLSSFTNHPMHMCRFRGFCQATQWRQWPWKRSIGDFGTFGLYWWKFQAHICYWPMKCHIFKEWTNQLCSCTWLEEIEYNFGSACTHVAIVKKCQNCCSLKHFPLPYHWNPHPNQHAIPVWPWCKPCSFYSWNHVLTNGHDVYSMLALALPRSV